ncbi:MAG: type IV pilus twitching motility protein PilT [Actinobacteria bacterium]|nr:MAG: type IV pilus twitching motility protein PilT [Actinomycetota bacterium]
MELIDEILDEVLEKGASDLHITAGLAPTVRIDGVLYPLKRPVLDTEAAKNLIYTILTDEQRARLETNLELDSSYSISGKSRWRVNVYYQRGSLGAAFRLIPVEIQNLKDLHLPPILEDLTKKPRGMVIVTGPTGVGKSTTLATMINVINERDAKHIITIEDPIEFLHKHKKSMVNQREVGHDTKSFASALKHVLREDPDVILLGEMRDVETIAAAITAAETGHLVFTTLHTQDAPQTVDRIIDVFPPFQQQQVRIQLAGILQGIVSQQLLPDASGKGRIPAIEILVATPAVRNIIREGKAHLLYNAMLTGQKDGMHTLDQALADLYQKGRVSYDSVMNRALDPQHMKSIIGRS